MEAAWIETFYQETDAPKRLELLKQNTENELTQADVFRKKLWVARYGKRKPKGYYSLLKGKNEIRLTKVLLGKKTIIATLPWKEKSVILRLVAKGATLTFYAGLSNDMLYQVGEVQSVDAVSDNKVNRFNGTGVGIYATSNGKQSINKASYQWFEYKEEN